MMMELVAWVKDGPYRLKVMRLLLEKSQLPSELAEKLNVNRASMSRILSGLKEMRFVTAIRGGSRTISYSITELGRRILRQI